MYPWLQTAWDFFLERLGDDRLAHAILLQGPGGTGKHDLARDMAKLLLCTDASDSACGTCRSCMLFTSGAHPDWFLLTPEEGKHQIIIESVRQTTRSLTLTTTISRRKVALIHPAEAMNVNAANALLKSLEEPPGETVIILVAHDASRLPVTIRSRCQAISIALPERGEATLWLQAERGLDESTALAALDASGGSPLRAAHYVETGQVEVHEGLRKSLGDLLRDPGGVSRVAVEFGQVDPETLWYWLSTSMAGVMRKLVTNRDPAWLEDAGTLDRKRLAMLQQAADRNRVLARTAVRQDLLLEEWLIEWAAQAG